MEEFEGIKIILRENETVTSKEYLSKILEDFEALEKINTGLKETIANKVKENDTLYGVISTLYEKIRAKDEILKLYQEIERLNKIINNS